MVLSELVEYVHAFATLWMVGLVWFVQVVHYPLFAMVEGPGFVAYEAAHCRRTNWVVGPPMLAEAGAALWLAVSPPSGVPAEVTWLGLGLLGLVWISTALLQVPSHARLSLGFDARAHRVLVATNWVRTAAWTVRGVIALAILGAH